MIKITSSNQSPLRSLYRRQIQNKKVLNSQNKKKISPREELLSKCGSSQNVLAIHVAKTHIDNAQNNISEFTVFINEAKYTLEEVDQNLGQAKSIVAELNGQIKELENERELGIVLFGLETTSV
ncbi:MAG: hypothetical protein QNJ31_06655 [Candidatus Caenarcaniphilales bacterium]|nr:hypothetical protein [Candidatus Caenarcaniphilales bacterium]